MKKILWLLGGFFLFGVRAYAGERQTQPDFYATSTAGNISVSTSSWTRVPTVNDQSRLAILFGPYASNNSNMLIQMTNTTTAPSSLTSGFALIKGNSPWLLSIGPNIYLWAISLNGGSGNENLYYQELK